jgi:hypothetical protein
LKRTKTCYGNEAKDSDEKYFQNIHKDSVEGFCIRLRKIVKFNLVLLKTMRVNLELNAGVVRIDSQGIGLAFRNLSNDDLQVLDKIE